jgi:hypothetical protein
MWKGLQQFVFTPFASVYTILMASVVLCALHDHCYLAAALILVVGGVVGALLEPKHE